MISFSGGVDIVPRLEYYRAGGDAGNTSPALMENVYGDLDQAIHGEHNIFDLAKNYDTSKWPLPKLFACCGEQDERVYSANRKLEEVYRGLGGDVTFYSAPGRHNFHFWNQALEKVIYEWLPLD